MTPDGRHGVVSHFGADRLSLVNLPTGRKLYVSCEGSHELYVIAIPEKWVTESTSEP